MKAKHLFLIALFILPAYTFAQLGPEQDAVQHEYLTIRKWTNYVIICDSKGNFKKENIKDEFVAEKGTVAVEDDTPVLKRISELEKEGWELFTYQIANNMPYVVMRRELVE